MGDTDKLISQARAEALLWHEEDDLCVLLTALADALEAAQAERDTLALTLTRIAENAEDWHGPLPDMGHVRALRVIATWSRAALAAVPGEASDG